MQTLSFREAKSSFLDATSLLDVRVKLKETTWGKRYLTFLWAANAFLVVLALSYSPSPYWAVLVGYFSLMFSREIVTLKSTFELNRLQFERLRIAQLGAAPNAAGAAPGER